MRKILMIRDESNERVLAQGFQRESEPRFNAISRIVVEQCDAPPGIFVVSELVERISPTRYRVPMGLRLLGNATDLSSFPTVLVDVIAT